MSLTADEAEPPREAHDAVLAAPAVDHDAEFADFMAGATPALARTAWLLCGDAHQADELVQQALVRTYLAWPRARERDPLAYARRTLANLRVETWRRRRRESSSRPATSPTAPSRAPPRPTGTPTATSSSGRSRR